MTNTADIQQTIQQKILVRIREMVNADRLPKDPAVLLATRIGDLQLDSLDLLTLAMKLEDDLGRSIELDEIDDDLSVTALAQKLSALVE